MRSLWPSTLPPAAKSCLCVLIISPYKAYARGPYPVSPDALACSQFLGRPLFHSTCQAAADNLPRGTLPTIFTTRAHTATNNYIQVPLHYTDAEPKPSCMITIDLDGHSQSDQFVFVPWNEVRDMALQLVDSCVYFLSRGGFITYGVGRTLESLIYPTTYGGDNAEFPYPAWVWEPDGTAEFVAIPSNPATDEYSKFCCIAADSQLAIRGSIS